MTFFLHEQFYRDLSTVRDRLITICGVGALGANLAETLARMGFSNLRIVDRDRIEAHNLSTQPWQQQDIGAPKVRVLANTLYRAVAARIEPKHDELNDTNAKKLIQGSAVVVDAFDNLPSRRAVADATTTLHIPCLHIAFSSTSDYGCGLWGDSYHTERSTQGEVQGQVSTPDQQPAPPMPNPQLRPAAPQDVCDYPLTRPLALLIVAVAAEIIVDHLNTASQRGFEFTLRDMRLVLV